MSASALVDTHVHLDRLGSAGEIAAALDAARAAGVGRFVVPGVRRAGWRDVIAAVRRSTGALAAPGLHPMAAAEWDEACAAELAALLERPEVVAVGEIGLDGLLAAPSLEVQERALRGQLRLAGQSALPVLLHCRQAIGRLLKILDEEGAARSGGILHAFSGSVESALQAVEMGFAIGFGGTLTFPGARRAPEVLGRLPAEAIVLETDAPDLAPHPHRGEPNRPAWLTLVAERVGELRGWSRDETARITTANANRVLRLD